MAFKQLKWNVCLCLLIALFSYLQTSWADDQLEDGYLFSKKPVQIKMRINIGLLGTGIDTRRLVQTLNETLKTHTPHFLQSHQRMNVEYQLQYKADMLPVLEAYEDFILRSLQERVQKPPLTGGVYDVEVSQQIRTYFESLLYQYFPLTSMTPAPGDYAIFIAKPNKEKIAQQLGIPDLKYIWRYGDSQIATQSWISLNRFLVVDLSSGPSSLVAVDNYWEKNSGEKPPIISSPIFPKTEGTRDTERLEGKLASVIISAVRNVFVSDLEFPVDQHADKILIPIIVLKNHDRWNPWEEGTEYSIDLNAIRQIVQLVKGPNQEIRIVTAQHTLQDHKDLALLIPKSIRRHSFYQHNLKSIELHEKDILDAKQMMFHLKNSHDLLASLVHSRLDTDDQRAFFNPQLPQELIDEEMLKVLEQPTTPSGAFKKSKKPKAKTLGSVGTRILPIYVFSLTLRDGLPQSFQFHYGHPLLHVTPEAAIVLQTNASKVFVPFYFEGKPLEVSAKSITNEIASAICKLVGGVADPTDRYSSAHEQIIKDLSWVSGEIPFGLWNHNSHLSQIYVDTVLRNAVLSRLHTSWRLIEDSFALINEFAKTYLRNPFMESEDSELEGAEWKNYADELYHDPLPESVASIAPTTLQKLHRQAELLQTTFNNLAELLNQYKLDESYQRSVSLQKLASNFHGYVKSQIKEAEDELLCCYLHKEVRFSGSSWIWFVLYILLFAGSVSLAYIGYYFYSKRTVNQK